jgi:hypothetical protein
MGFLKKLANGEVNCVKKLATAAVNLVKKIPKPVLIGAGVVVLFIIASQFPRYPFPGDPLDPLNPFNVYNLVS